jgi:hypothetical protein
MTNIYAATLSSLVDDYNWLAETTGAAKANGWLYVITLTTKETSDSNSEQKLQLGINNYNADTDKYRVAKTLANQNWFTSGALPFNDGDLYSATVGSVSFQRTVKIQLKELDISQVKINGVIKPFASSSAPAPAPAAPAAPADLGTTGNGRKLNNSIPFSATTLAAQAAGWNRVTTIVGGLNAGNGNSQAAQTMEINVTYAPGGAQYRILKTKASADPADPFIGDSQNLVLGMNTITVPAVSWANVTQGRDVKVQFSSGDIEFSILYKNGNVASYGISNTCDKFNGTYCGETNRIYAPTNNLDGSYKDCENEKCDWENYFECCEYGQKCIHHTCPETYVLKTDAFSRYCADTSCVADDTNECCNARGTCTENTCTETHVLKTDAGTINCTGASCNEDECCDARGTCIHHTCPETTHVLKTDANTIYCTGTSCGDDDTNECCDAKGTCTENTCTETHVLKPDANTIYCTGASCDEDECCNARGTCTENTCPETTHVLKTDANTIYCTGTACGEDECCKDRPDCEINPDAKGHVNYIGTEVLDYAFKKCDTLTSFSGPNVTSIGPNSFGTGLNAVYLPKFEGVYSGALPTFYKSNHTESNAELCTCFIDENELCLKKSTGVASCLAKDTVESAMQHCNSVKHAYNAQCGCN